MPEAAIEAAVAVMRSGRLHRYNLVEGEIAETALLEQEFAATLGVPYCLATASGGTAMQIALVACGVESGDAVLTNAFTLSPVPGAIHGVGGKPVIVETTETTIVVQPQRSTQGPHLPAHLCQYNNFRLEPLGPGRFGRRDFGWNRRRETPSPPFPPAREGVRARLDRSWDRWLGWSCLCTPFGSGYFRCCCCCCCCYCSVWLARLPVRSSFLPTFFS